MLEGGFAMKSHDNDQGHSHDPARQLDDPRVIEALDEYLAALEVGPETGSTGVSVASRRHRRCVG